MGKREMTKGAVRDALLATGLNEFWKTLDIRSGQNAPGSTTVVIEFQYHDITFDELSLISEALGTRKINLDNEVREGGYCETCRFSYNVTTITAMEVVLPDLED